MYAKYALAYEMGMRNIGVDNRVFADACLEEAIKIIKDLVMPSLLDLFNRSAGAAVDIIEHVWKLGGLGINYIDLKIQFEELTIYKTICGILADRLGGSIIVATDGVYTNKVVVHWEDIFINGEPADNYLLTRSSSTNIGDSNYRKYVTGDGVHEDTFVTPGQTYYYWIKGENDFGDSGDGNPDSGYAALAPRSIIRLTGNMAFGDIVVGQNKSSTLTIHNDGQKSLNVTSISLADGFAGNWSGSVPANSSANVTINFNPSMRYDYLGLVSVNSDADDGNVNLNISGRGVESEIQLGGNVSFGDVTIGSSASRTLTIRNIGNKTFNVTGIQVPSGFSGSWSGPIAEDGEQAVNITFSPQSPTQYIGDLQVNSDAMFGAKSLACSGTGVWPPAPASSLLVAVQDHAGNVRSNACVIRAGGGSMVTNFTDGNGFVQYDAVYVGSNYNFSAFYGHSNAFGLEKEIWTTNSYLHTTNLILATDTACDAAYNSGSYVGTNAGSGFGVWTSSMGANTDYRGSFVGNSTANGGGTGPGINCSSNKAWGLYANRSNLAEVVRALPPGSLATGQTFHVEIDNGWHDGTNTSAGFGLQDANGVNRFELFHLSGKANYSINDLAGGVDTGIGWTEGGLTIDFTLNSSSNYTVRIIAKQSGVTNVLTRNLATGGAICKVRFFYYSIYNEGGSARDFFFNNIYISSPVAPYHLLRRDFPYLSGFRVYDATNGVMLDGVPTIAVDRLIRFAPAVTNRHPESRDIRVRMLLDRDKAAPYDFDITWTNLIASKTTAVFSVTNAMLAPGAYNYALSIKDQAVQETDVTDWAPTVVVKIPATISLAGMNQTYDGLAKTATVETAPPGLPVEITYNGTLSAPTNAGSYAVTCTVNDVDHQGSAIGTLVISKADATVTLGGLAQAFDGMAKTATAVTVPEGLPATISYNGSYSAPSNAGLYAVTATVNHVNYQGVATGVLSIARAVAGVSLGSLSQTYNGTPKSPTVDTIPASLPAMITYNGSPVNPTAAGLYVVTATVNHVNYQGMATGTLTIAKANAAVTLGSLLQTYNGSPKTVTATTTPDGLNIAFSYNGNSNAPANAGTYSIVGSVFSDNYMGSANGVLIVEKASQTIDFQKNGDQILTNEVRLTATASSGLAVTYAVQEGPAIIADGTNLTFTGEGTVSIVATQAGDDNWNPAPEVTNAFAVTKASAPVYLQDLAQTYDGTERTVTATTMPAGLTVVITYNGLAEAPTNAGSYAVTGTVSSPLYQGVTNDTLVVDRATDTITFGETNQTYSGMARAVTATAGSGSPVELTYDGLVAAPTNAGSYAVMGIVDAVNWRGTNTTTLVVAKADQSIAFPSLGDKVATDTVCLSSTASSGMAVAFVVGSGPGSISGGTNLTFAGTGSVSIVASQGGDGNWNPALEVTNTFAVTKAEQSELGFAPASPQTYNTVGILATTGGSGTGAVSYAVLSGPGEIVGADGLKATSGTGDIVVEATKSGDNLFLVQTSSATVTVQEASQTIDFPAIGDKLTIDLIGLSATASSSLPVSFGVVGGFAFISGGTNLTFTGTGVVSVVASQDGDANWNPASSVTNTFNVTKAPAAVYLQNLAQTYDGTARAVTATTMPAGLTVEIAYDGGAEAPTDSGSYAVSGMVSSAMYEGETNSTLVVERAPDTITFGATNQTYDGTARTVTVTSGSGSPVALTYNGWAVAPTNAGNYAVTGIVDAVNWRATNTTTLAVAKAGQTITFPAIGDKVTTDLVELTASSLSGLPVLFTISSGPSIISGYTNLTFTGTGTVNVVASQGGDGNWNPALDVTNVFQVTEAEAQVYLLGLTQVYDGSVRTVTATTMPAGLTVVITYKGSAMAPTTAGSYAVTGTVTDVSYKGVASGELQVEKKELVVSGAVAQNKVYDGSDVATIIGANLVGKVSGDDVALANEAMGTFSQVEAGNDIEVATAPMTIEGSDKDNYALTQPSGLKADILKALPNVTTWPLASTIIYGQMLAESLLSGGSATPLGSFAFTFPNTTPTVGTASQSIFYTPSDTNNFNLAYGSVIVTVNRPPMTSMVIPPNGSVMSATIATLTGITYALEYTTNLFENPAIWMPAASKTATNGEVTLQDSSATNIQRFYRIVIP